MINRLIDENILDQKNFEDLLQYLEFDDKEEAFIKYNSKNNQQVSAEDIKSFLEENPLCLYKERSTYNLIYKNHTTNPLKKPINPEEPDSEIMDEVKKVLCAAIIYMQSPHLLGIYLTNDPLIIVSYLYRDSGFYRSGKEIGEPGHCYDQNQFDTSDYVMEGMVTRMENLFFKTDFNQLYLMYKEEVRQYHLNEWIEE